MSLLDMIEIMAQYYTGVILGTLLIFIIGLALNKLMGMIRHML